MRDIHLAYVSGLTPADLTGDPNGAHIDDRDAWKTVSAVQMGVFVTPPRTKHEQATVLDPDDLPIVPDGST